LRHELAAAPTCAGTELNEPVRFAHDLEIVLDDDDGISLVAQALEHADEAFGVGRVQTDRRLVENVERSAKSVSELGREIDSLKFTARKSFGKAREGEVPYTDFI
jgi:hypothetical protein